MHSTSQHSVQSQYSLKDCKTRSPKGEDVRARIPERLVIPFTPTTTSGRLKRESRWFPVVAGDPASPVRLEPYFASSPSRSARYICPRDL